MLTLSLAPLSGALSPLPALPPWLGRLLHARGVCTAEEAERFLHPALDQLQPPSLLRDMDKAVSLLQKARDQGKTAAIYGDYDVDGVCASAILWEAFHTFGLLCQVYIPDRHQEGYGLNTPAVEKLAKTCQVLVTVDCGIVSVPEVAAAKAAGMDVIVTDHHRHGDTLPPAEAVITPLLGDYPFPFLCGAGVAWKLALALLGEGAMPLMELAALATVADMVPLTGENRVIVAKGLERIATTGRPGLRALMRLSGMQGQITSDQIAFQIAPRMNASGRMASARTAFELLLTRDQAQADMLALQLENLNRERRNQENQVLEEAKAQVDQMDLVDTRAIVVAGEGWSSGVVGLAAGRIAEKYAYPTVALALAGDTCVGSARSAGEVDIYAALSECADLFERFGGHRQAAGLTLKKDNLPAFRKRLSAAVARQTGGRAPVSSIMCDGEMALKEVTEETIHWLSLLEPYGMGNPAPRFLCRGVTPLSLRAVGAEGRHLKCTFQQGNALRDGIFFGGGAQAGETAGEYTLVMTPTANAFRGKISAECRLYAMQLQPESLPREPGREEMALLLEARGAEAAAPLQMDTLKDLMQGDQGTLLVCRCLETAMALRKRFPQADFALQGAFDPRAYHTVVLYGRAQGTCASFRNVVLCDGDLGEAGAYQRACPGARVWALPQTAAARELLERVYVDIDGLRQCYRVIRDQVPLDLEGWARQCGLSLGQGAFALKVLLEIGLIEGALSPLRVSLPPMRKKSPEESGLFRLARQAKEENHGVHGV